MIPTPKGVPTYTELFACRISEAVAYAFGELEKDQIPQWVLNVSKKLWIDLMPRGTELPKDDEKVHFAWGLLLGSSPRTSLNIPNAEKALDEVFSRTRPGSIAPEELTEAKQKLSGGTTPTELYSESHRAQILADFLASEPCERLAFANGLALGAKALEEVEAGIFTRKGGSPRRIVWLLLWLNWPNINDEVSVARVYEILGLMFQFAGKSDLLGDSERFKKLAADICLKLPKESRQGKL
jgi:hypothetical protein